tara:strand:- start:111 stop:548 length:438 start_codon:yes stop_codon:yes gene_type:complete
MATTISTNGRKKLKTLQDEFNDKFSHLKLEFYSKPTIDEKDRYIVVSAKDKLDNSKTLSEVRTKTGDGEISINGRKNVGTLEKEFQDVFGLFVQIDFWCEYRKNGKKTGKEHWSKKTAIPIDDWSLTEHNDLWKDIAKTKPKKDW